MHCHTVLYSPQFISSRPPGQWISPPHSAVLTIVHFLSSIWTMDITITQYYTHHSSFFSSTWTMDITVTQYCIYSPQFIFLVHLDNGYHRHTVLYTHHSSFFSRPPGQWISSSQSTINSPQFISSRPRGQWILPSHSVTHLCPLVHLDNGYHRHIVLYTHHSSFPLVHLDSGYRRHTRQTR